MILNKLIKKTIDRIVKGDKWESFDLTVKSDRNDLTVSWSDADEAAKYVLFQAGCFGKTGQPFSKQMFYNESARWYQNLWNISNSLGTFKIPDNAKVIDVGSGIGIIDLLLYSYVPNCKLYLLDKEEFNLKKNIFYKDDYFFYHDWGPTKDAISTSKFDQDRFTFLNPSDSWPDDVDLIMSHFSWCVHYPKEKYWGKVLQSLKIGGILHLDVRPISDRDIIGEISEDLKSSPKIYPFENSVKSGDIMYDKFNNSEVIFNRCVWERKK